MTTRREEKPRIEARESKSQVIQTRILAHLAANGPSKNTALQIALGRSPSTLYYHVDYLAKAGKIHNEPIQNEANRNIEAVWHLGENPNKSTDPEMVQRRVKVWPLHHVRDSLVAALFGAPQRVAA